MCGRIRFQEAAKPQQAQKRPRLLEALAYNTSLTELSIAANRSNLRARVYGCVSESWKRTTGKLAQKELSLGTPRKGAQKKTSRLWVLNPCVVQVPHLSIQSTHLQEANCMGFHGVPWGSMRKLSGKDPLVVLEPTSVPLSRKWEVFLSCV